MCLYLLLFVYVILIQTFAIKLSERLGESAKPWCEAQMLEYRLSIAVFKTVHTKIFFHVHANTSTST